MFGKVLHWNTENQKFGSIDKVTPSIGCAIFLIQFPQSVLFFGHHDNLELYGFACLDESTIGTNETSIRMSDLDLCRITEMVDETNFDLACKDHCRFNDSNGQLEEKTYLEGNWILVVDTRIRQGQYFGCITPLRQSKHQDIWRGDFQSTRYARGITYCCLCRFLLLHVGVVFTHLLYSPLYKEATSVAQQSGTTRCGRKDPHEHTKSSRITMVCSLKCHHPSA